MATAEPAPAALILAYALFRWGSGREAASGLGVILLWLAITYVADHFPVRVEHSTFQFEKVSHAQHEGLPA